MCDFSTHFEFALAVRKTKKTETTLSGPTKWEFEIGQDLMSRSVFESHGIVENINNVSMFVHLQCY